MKLVGVLLGAEPFAGNCCKGCSDLELKGVGECYLAGMRYGRDLSCLPSES